METWRGRGCEGPKRSRPGSSHLPLSLRVKPEHCPPPPPLPLISRSLRAAAPRRASASVSYLGCSASAWGVTGLLHQQGASVAFFPEGFAFPALVRSVASPGRGAGFPAGKGLWAPGCGRGHSLETVRHPGSCRLGPLGRLRPAGREGHGETAESPLPSCLGFPGEGPVTPVPRPAQCSSLRGRRLLRSLAAWAHIWAGTNLSFIRGWIKSARGFDPSGPAHALCRERAGSGGSGSASRASGFPIRQGCRSVSGLCGRSPPVPGSTHSLCLGGAALLWAGTRVTFPALLP